MIFPAENPPGAVVIYLEIDNRKCEITRDVECFSSATGVRHTFFFSYGMYLFILYIYKFRLLDFWLLLLLVTLFLHHSLSIEPKVLVLGVKFLRNNLEAVRRWY